jgi:sporulation-control protein spo0M
MDKYVNSMYFAITTMATVGYGDIKPTTTLEREVVCGLELIAGITFAYIIGSIGQIFGRYNILAQSY